MAAAAAASRAQGAPDGAQELADACATAAVCARGGLDLGAVARFAGAGAATGAAARGARAVARAGAGAADPGDAVRVLVLAACDELLLAASDASRSRTGWRGCPVSALKPSQSTKSSASDAG
eukprot:1637000-Prymnesium_polylepis.1